MSKAIKVFEVPGQSIDGTNFQAIATGTGTIVTTTATQTLTNKTLTAPTLTAPVITGAATIADGATLTTPAITADYQALAAAGGNIATAAAITVSAPGVVLSSGGNNAAGIQLPAGNVGDIYFIKNNAADILFVYPQVNSTINAIAANTKINLATVTGAAFIKTSATAWHTIPVVPS